MRIKLWVLASASVMSITGLRAQNEQTTVTIDWNKIIANSKTHVSIQDCPEPPLFRSSPIHDKLYKALRDLNSDYARLQPWFPYPKISVAELEPPEGGKAHWDFSVMDEITEDFMEATKGHPVVFDFGTLPAWMYKTKTPLTYPTSPEAIDWEYQPGTPLRDPTMKEAAEYQARLADWYTKGGFHDEYGRWHASNHRYNNIAYWEVLNEIDGEPNMSPEYYTRLYDTIVEEIQQSSPRMKFMGLALSDPVGKPEYLEYFLDPKNHKAGTPIDMISYHFYSMADPGETPATMQYSIFDQADKFIAAVRYIEMIRKQSYPNTGTYVDELGSMLPDPKAPNLKPIPDSYWSLAGGMWAYVYGHLAELGIQIIGAAELIDYPGQFAATTLVNWDSGQPNARYWVVKLLHDDFEAGDKVAEANIADPGVYAQAFLTSGGKRKILLVNKRDKQVELRVPGAAGGEQEMVDQTTRSSPAKTLHVTDETVSLPGLAVAVVTLGS